MLEVEGEHQIGSQGSAEEGKEPSGALLTSHEELEHYVGECGGLDSADKGNIFYILFFYFF